MERKRRYASRSKVKWSSFEFGDVEETKVCLEKWHLVTLSNDLKFQVKVVVDTTLVMIFNIIAIKVTTLKSQ